MKKLTSCLSVVLLSALLITNTYAKSYNSAEEAINDANTFIEKYFEVAEYYKTEVKINGATKGINEDLAKRGTDTLDNKPVFVYGDMEEVSKSVTSAHRDYVKKAKEGAWEYRSLGYARDGSAFPNPAFPPDNSGGEATDKKWVKEPWLTEEYGTLQAENGKTEIIQMAAGYIGYIKKWIGAQHFSPQTLGTLESINYDRKFIAKQSITVPPSLEDNFEDFLYVIQPPTEHSWGLGIAFYYWNNNGHLNYRTLRLQHYDNDDIKAEYDAVMEPPSTEFKGERVEIGVMVTGNFGFEPKNDPFT